MPRVADIRKQQCGWGPQNETPRNHEIFVCQHRDDMAGRFATQFYIAGQTDTGEGKSVRLWKDLVAVTGKNPDTVPQPTGNCFPPGTMVMMADGSEKRIEDVEVGDMVVTHHNRTRKVTRLFARPYTGDIVTIRVQKHGRKLSATPDHRLVCFPGMSTQGLRRDDQTEVWESLEHLSIGDRVLLPRGMPQRYEYETVECDQFNFHFNSGTVTSGEIGTTNTRGKIHRNKHVIPERIVIDEQMGRLIGLYLAEGGSRKNRIDFSFNANEEHTLAQEVIDIIRAKFGLECTKRFMNRDSVCMVRCGSTSLSRLFKHLVPGNVYSKAVPDVIQRAPFSVRRQCLLGWIDGDGHVRTSLDHKKQRLVRITGVTASDDLAHGMERLARSLGLHPSVTTRKQAPHQTTASKTVELCSTDCAKLTRDYTLAIRKETCRVANGVAAKIMDRTVGQMRNGTVHCLEVEDDHSFIANGFAVHNCVAAGFEHALEGCAASEILAGDLELWRPQFNPFNYWAGRVIIGKNRLRGGAGSLGSWSAQAGVQIGNIAADMNGLPQYTKAAVDAWGDGKAYNGIKPETFRPLAGEHKLRVWGLLHDWSQVRDALYHRYGVTTASNQGYTMKPGRSGFHERSGNWAHQMCVYGYSEEGRIPWVAIYNSWGNVHGQVRDPDTGELWPPGLLCVRRDDFIRGHLTPSTECCVLSKYDGYPARYDWKRIVHGRKRSTITPA